MRPIRLEVQGLTAYREPVEVDFTELDLFGITGPTGAGKSSLVDAITYALFGKAPRVGNQIKELISQGSDRVKVSLEFSANGGRYRVHRASARKGQAPVQLERLDGEEWQPIADRATEVTQEIEDLLRMDYEAFIRSVLLPQGEFQEFLAGDRDQRRKVLDGLLRLGVYTTMGQKANAIAARESADADRISERLATELADATPEALKGAKAHLKEMEEHAAALTKIRETIDKACRLAETLAAEWEKRYMAAQSAKELNRKLQAIQSTIGEVGKQLAEIDIRIADARERLKRTEYDADLHLRLTRCLPLVREMARNTERRDGLSAQIEKDTHSAAKLADEADAERARHAKLVTAAEARHQEFEEARKVNAAALLRQSLAAGDPCPVCGQTVGALPGGEHLALDHVKSTAEAARKEADAAQHKVAAAQQRVALANQALAGLKTQLDELSAEQTRVAEEFAALTAGYGLESKSVEPKLLALEATKAESESLAREEKALLARREEAAATIQSAQTEGARLEAQIKVLIETESNAASGAAKALEPLLTTAREHDWPEVTSALSTDSDPSPALRVRLQSASRRETEANQDIGLSRARIAEIQKNIDLAKKLKAEEEEHKQTARIARDLASLLRADKFPTFIRERAMRTLAAGGSEWLKQISGGRYDLVVDGQDFVVEDLWNAGDRRSVKTLSGGETFLASLALALALAEQLPSLASPGTASSLESLFIDEGFSHLDAETLDIVASALEVLGQDRRRLIGVITHVPALAERMPARIVVHKSQSGSTVSIE